MSVRRTKQGDRHAIYFEPPPHLFLFFGVLGISFKSQLLYAIVFLTRYLDLFVKFLNPYNTFMKVFFIGSSLYILFLMKAKFKATYDASLDTFRVEYLLGGAAVLALLTTEDYKVREVSEPYTTTTTITGLMGMDRLYGPFRFGLNPWLSYLNCSCCNALVRRKRSRHITCLLWAAIGRYISLTGCIGMLPKDMWIGSLGSLGCCKRLSTVISSISITQSKYF